MVSLRFDDWFTPFRPEYPVHPWLDPTTEAELPGWFADEADAS
jgi:hypothetical protein